MIGAILAKRKVPAGFEALNNHDLDAFLADWDDDVVLVYPGDIPGVSGTYEGIAAVRAFYERDFAQFPELKLTPHHIAVSSIFDITGNNTIAIQWDADATNKDGYSIQNSGVTIMQIRNARVVHTMQYIFNTGKEFRKAWGSD